LTVKEPISQSPRPAADAIPTPWRQQWRRIRFQLLPVLVFGLTILGTAWLWQNHYAPVESVGVVHVKDAVATSPGNGVLVAGPEGFVNTHDYVRKGQALAKLDDQELQASLKAAKSERTRLESDRQRILSAAQSPDTRATLQMLESALGAVEERILEIQLRLDRLVIRSPLDGYVTKVTLSAGQTAAAGQIIAEIASSHSNHIVAYVGTQQHLNPQLGMAVEIRSRNGNRQPSQSRIESVGPAIERVPRENLRDPSMVEWGVPVTISIPGDVSYSPGEIVDLRFLSELSNPADGAR
jgi:multidrug resistance efflux pump